MDLHLRDAFPHLSGCPLFWQHELYVGIIHPTDFVIEPFFYDDSVQFMVMRGGMRMERLKAVRIAKGLRADDIAEAAWISLRSYRRYETGLMSPKVCQAIDIADALGVDDLRQIWRSSREQGIAGQRGVENERGDYERYETAGSAEGGT